MDYCLYWHGHDPTILEDYDSPLKQTSGVFDAQYSRDSGAELLRSCSFHFFAYVRYFLMINGSYDTYTVGTFCFCFSIARCHCALIFCQIHPQAPHPKKNAEEYDNCRL